MQAPAKDLGWSRWLLVLGALFLCCCGRAHADVPAQSPSAQAMPAAAEGYSSEAAEEPAPVEELAAADAAPPPPPASLIQPAKAAAPKTTTPAPASAPTASPLLAATPGTDKRSPLLIYTATIAMAVFGKEEALDAVEALAKSRNGYLVKRSDASITIRVPADAFEAALNGLKGLGDELNRDVSARDVSEEYADLEVRLRNAEVVRQRLEVLLARAGNVEDALAVERELGRVTQTIEQIKGKLKLLGELVAFSTITVNFQVRSVEPIRSEVTLPFGWLQQLGLSNLLAL